MPELIFEIFTEEIPANLQIGAIEELRKLISLGLQDSKLEFSSIETHATPRRLVALVEGLPKRTKSELEVQKGPRLNAPEVALSGFLKSVGCSSLGHDNIYIVNKKKGEFYEYRIEHPPKPTEVELAKVLEFSMERLSWPKSMRWSNYNCRWVRPIRNILAVFNARPIEFSFPLIRGKNFRKGSRELNVLKANNRTLGHRILAPDIITITTISDYKEELFHAKVMFDFNKRRRIIEKEAKSLAHKHNLVLRVDQKLLDEVAGLVEWPVILMGKIDSVYMDLPSEVLITAMRSHQRYFSCLNKESKIANRFIIVANIEADDRGVKIITGNERVLRARLSDSKFFWERDLKSTLEEKIPALKGRTFHEKLGSVFDKVNRLAGLAAVISPYVPGCIEKKSILASRLSKADLSTGMVSEFPALQGVIGRYYALHENIEMSIADAIAEHYTPMGPNDKCPYKPISVCVALADKIDLLVCFWSIGEKPTGSKDPFALRRAALGVIRIILENKLRINLLKIFENVFFKIKKNDSGCLEDLLSFVVERLKIFLKGQGVRHDHIDAIFFSGIDDDLVRIMDRVNALGEFLATDDGKNLLIACRRTSHILGIEEKKDNQTYFEKPQQDKFVQFEEKDLFNKLIINEAKFLASIKNEKYTEAMQSLAKLREPIDTFFEKVTVNSQDVDIRSNRLKLLSSIRSSLNLIADFSYIEI
jgi:glycyl-tRNA synthetase beta chain